jgi:hypothetical protein
MRGQKNENVVDFKKPILFIKYGPVIATLDNTRNMFNQVSSATPLTL